MRLAKKMLSIVLCAAMVLPMSSVNGLNAQAAGEVTIVPYSSIAPRYNVDCGDFDVTSPAAGEEMGAYQSVTEQVYKADAKTGKMWGLVDNYDVTPPSANLNNSGTGGIQTNWTWPHENGGWSASSPKSSTNRYTKNQYEQRSSFGDTRKLDYSFELEPGDYTFETLCVDPWSCSKTPTVSLNGGTAAKLIAGTVYKTNFTIPSGSNKLDVSYRGTGSDNLAVNVAYITISNEKYSKLYAASKNCNYAVDEKIYEDFTLPVNTSDCTVAWTSDNAAISISGNKAQVTRAATDVVVTLNATITDPANSVATVVEYTTTVKGTDSVSGTGLKDFGEEDVLITDAYYNNAFDKEVDYLLLLDPDRLLAGFRETAAYAAGYSSSQRTSFMKNTTRYAGWENSRIGGHTLGHYMSSLARAYTNAEATEEQRAALLNKINACVTGLKECQALTVGSSYCKEGYLFGATIDNGGTTVLEYQFDRMEGKSSIGGDWVPWYTMHKIMSGIVDVAKYTGNEDAKEVATKLGLWVYNRNSTWDTAMKNKVLGVEYGGMNDCLYDLYALIKNDPTYGVHASKILAAAEKFDETNLFERVKNGGTNVLNGRHANTTIPKFVGAIKRYMVLGEKAEDYLVYAEKFWDMVITHHTYITGGNSENEHFGADDILYGEETTVNNETCNTYNMLKLSRELFKATGDIKYADYYENTFINAIMASQNPETGMSMYFQPMASGYHKVFGKETTDFWCCTGSGIENFTKLNDSIYYHDAATIVVGQYLSSEVTWADKNVKVIQKSGIQSATSETAEFEVQSLGSGDANVNLALRIPDWVSDQGNKMTVKLNGTEISELSYYDFNGQSDQKRFVVVGVHKGDKVTVTTPMEVVAKNVQDSKNTYAFKYGPVVLSAKLGHDKAYQTEAGHGVNVRRSSTSAVTSDKIGIYASDSVSEYMNNINANMTKTGTTFKLTGANFNYDFVPHYSQYTDNYGIYWTYYVGEMDSESIIRDKDANRKDRVTVDSVQAGYGQYEPGLSNTTGNVGSSTEHIRYATAGGYFEYEIKVDQSKNNYLLLTLRREDDGLPLNITAGGQTILSKSALNSKDGTAIQGMLSDSDFTDYYQIKVPVPEAVAKAATTNTDGDKVVRFRFSGSSAKDSARLYNWSYMVTDYEKTNKINALSIDGKTITGSGDTNLTSTSGTITVNGSIADTKGYIAVNGQAIPEGKNVSVPLADIKNEITIEAYAEDFNVVDTVKVTVIYDMRGMDISGNLKKHFSFDDTLDGAITVQKADTPSQISKTVSYTTGATGFTGRSLVMDGSFGLLLGNASILGEEYTVSFFMKPNSVGAEYNPTFCAGVFNPEYWLSLTLDGKIWSNHNGKVATKVSKAYKANQWQHVAVSIKREPDSSAGASGVLYVNGVEVSRGGVASGIMTNNNAKLYFGVNRWDAIFSGGLDEVTLYNTALSEADIVAISKGYIDGSGKITELYTKAFNDATGQIAAPTATTVPTKAPTQTPTKAPTQAPTKAPTQAPTNEPEQPTSAPTEAPSDTPMATNEPTKAPDAATPVPSGAPQNTQPSASAAPQTDSNVPAVGTEMKAGNIIYKVTSNKTGKLTVTVKKAANKKLTKIVIPKKVKINGTSFKVVSINKNAFKGCKKLKQITIKSTTITKIGKKAFSGIAKKAKIKVPKKKKNIYKKLLKKAKYKGKVY